MASSSIQAHTIMYANAAKYSCAFAATDTQVDTSMDSDPLNHHAPEKTTHSISTNHVPFILFGLKQQLDNYFYVMTYALKRSQSRWGP